MALDNAQKTAPAPLDYLAKNGQISSRELEAYLNSGVYSNGAQDKKLDLLPFHRYNRYGEPTSVIDSAIFNYILFSQRLFFLGGIPYIYGNGVYRADEGGCRLKSLIRQLIEPNCLTSNIVNRIYGLFLQAAELQRSCEEINCYPQHWINFKNAFYDPISEKLIPHDSKFYAVNQIPHDFDPIAKPDGDKILAWLSSTFDDSGDLEMRLQYNGLLLTRDTRQQKMLIILGLAATGKSTDLRLTELMLGSDNVSHISLGELGQRFATYGLVGKSANICADLEISALEDVALLKKLVGEDVLRVEKKGVDSFSYRPYARLLFSTNELPTVKAERSRGFYRRLLILQMNKQPERAIPDFFEQLSSQIDFYIHLCVEALSRMYKCGRIAESQNSMRLVEQLHCDSDTAQAFIDENTDICNGIKLERGRLYDRYERYCFDSDRQPLSKNGFYKALRAKGFQESASGGVRYFEGKKH